MITFDARDPESIVAWAIFRVEEPDNLGSPDPECWSAIYLPKAREVIAECAAQGYQIGREIMLV
jgi:hypothetical protein